MSKGAGWNLSKMSNLARWFALSLVLIMIICSWRPFQSSTESSTLWILLRSYDSLKSKRWCGWSQQHHAECLSWTGTDFFQLGQCGKWLSWWGWAYVSCRVHISMRSTALAFLWQNCSSRLVVLLWSSEIFILQMVFAMEQKELWKECHYKLLKLSWYLKNTRAKEFSFQESFTFHHNHKFLSSLRESNFLSSLLCHDHQQVTGTISHSCGIEYEGKWSSITQTILTKICKGACFHSWTILCGFIKSQIS